MIKDYYFLDEAPNFQGKYLLAMNHEMFLFPNGTRGSYAVFAARLLGLSYPDFLRFTRDRLGAELIGKNQRYVTPYFEKTQDVKNFVKILNAAMRYIMDEQRDPYEYIREEDGSITRIPFAQENGTDSGSTNEE